MTPEDPRLSIAQYLSGELSGDDRQEFEGKLAAHPELRLEVAEMRALWEDLGRLPQADPSPALRARFYQSLNALGRVSRNRSGAQLGSPWWRFAHWQQLAAAVILFAAGLYLGRTARLEGSRENELAKMRTQVQSLREMVALSLLDRQSAASRLQGVEWSNRVERPDSELLSALVSALNDDPNVNVRLSSVDALEKFSHDASVRSALVRSIARQDSPLVQIALIDSLAHVRDESAMEAFRKLSEARNVNAAVKQRANWALVRLDPAGHPELR